MHEREATHDDAESWSSGHELDDLPASANLLSHIERQDPLYSPSTSTALPPRSSSLNNHSSMLRHPTSTPSSLRDRTAFLDGLRGIGAFMVYSAHHVSWFYGPGNHLEYGFGFAGFHFFGQLPIIRLVFTGGNAAVSIFFVLSGYVLSIGPLRLLQQGAVARSEVVRSLKSAMVRRPFRLFIPPVGISLGVVVLLQLPDAVRPQIHWPEAESNVFWELVRWIRETVHMMNPFVRHGVFEAWYPYDPPAYTTAMEYQGSLLMFTALWIYSSVRIASTRAVLLGATGLVLLLTYQWAMAAFMFGAVLAANDLEGYDTSVLQSLSTRARSILHHGALSSALYLLSQPSGTRGEPITSRGTFGWYYLTQAIPMNYYHNEWWRYWNVIGATLLVYSVLRINWLQRLLLRPTFRFLGRISFALYLIHIPILWTIADRVYRFFGAIQQNEMTTWFDDRFPLRDLGPKGLSSGYLLIQVIVLPLTLLASELATRWLDVPGVRFSRWLSGRLGLEKAKNKEGVARLGHI